MKTKFTQPATAVVLLAALAPGPARADVIDPGGPSDAVTANHTVRLIEDASENLGAAYLDGTPLTIFTTPVTHTRYVRFAIEIEIGSTTISDPDGSVSDIFAFGLGLPPNDSGFYTVDFTGSDVDNAEDSGPETETYTATNHNTGHTFTYTVETVPEPSSALLVAIGAGLACARLRRRRLRIR